jgi:hypothetical protein
MNQTIKIVALAIVAAILGGGLVILGMKLATPSEKSAKNVAVTQDAANTEEDTSAPAKAPGKALTKKTPSANTAPSAAAPSNQDTGGNPTDAKLRALLSKYAWCSQSYNQYSGTSATTRYVFSPNGTFSMGGDTQTYNSGDAGSVAGQYGSSGGGQWKIQNLRLYISSADTGYQMVDVNASLTTNSEGWPIITVGGQDFMTCN